MSNIRIESCAVFFRFRIGEHATPLLPVWQTIAHHRFWLAAIIDIYLRGLKFPVAFTIPIFFNSQCPVFNQIKTYAKKLER